MKIESFVRPSPRQFTMTFSIDEGWAVLAAINSWAANHPQAVDHLKWVSWAQELEKELRGDVES